MEKITYQQYRMLLNSIRAAVNAQEPDDDDDFAGCISWESIEQGIKFLTEMPPTKKMEAFILLEDDGPSKYNWDPVRDFPKEDVWYHVTFNSIDTEEEIRRVIYDIHRSRIFHRPRMQWSKVYIKVGDNDTKYVFDYPHIGTYWKDKAEELDALEELDEYLCKRFPNYRTESVEDILTELLRQEAIEWHERKIAALSNIIVTKSGKCYHAEY